MKIICYFAALCAFEFGFVLVSPTSVQKNKKLVGNSVTPTGITIPNGYVTTPGIGTHKYHHLQQKNWNDARNTCLNEGAQLAVINSAAEEALFLTYMNSSRYEQFWIGIHELFKKDDWVTVKGERLDKIGYVHWRQNQPDGSPDEHCVTFNQNVPNNFGMNDFPCNQQLFFVCEL